MLPFATGSLTHLLRILLGFFLWAGDEVVVGRPRVAVIFISSPVSSKIHAITILYHVASTRLIPYDDHRRRRRCRCCRRLPEMSLL